MRSLKTKTTGARGVLITADDFVIGLLDRLIKTERRLDDVQKQLSEHFEMIAVQQPKLTADGLVTLLAMRVEGDTPSETTVTLKPVAGNVKEVAP